jgi:pyruvate formate lyase activating enzyme
MTVADVMETIRKDAAFYAASGGGVTISGGEPLLQPGFCRELAAVCQAEGITVLLDTAASTNTHVLQGLIPHIDHCYIDLKAADRHDYARMTGGDFHLVLRNMELLAASGVETTVRVPVIPGHSDCLAYAKRLAGVVKDSGLRAVCLLPFHNLGSGKYAAMSLPYAYKDTEPPDRKTMERIAAVFTDEGLITTIP